MARIVGESAEELTVVGGLGSHEMYVSSLQPLVMDADNKERPHETARGIPSHRLITWRLCV